jgi:hypothetical protein
MRSALYIRLSWSVFGCIAMPPNIGEPLDIDAKAQRQRPNTTLE